MSRIKTNADELRLLRRALRTAARHATQALARTCMSGATQRAVEDMRSTLRALAEQTVDLEADAELHLSALVRARRESRRRAAA